MFAALYCTTFFLFCFASSSCFLILLYLFHFSVFVWFFSSSSPSPIPRIQFLIVKQATHVLEGVFTSLCTMYMLSSWHELLIAFSVLKFDFDWIAFESFQVIPTHWKHLKIERVFVSRSVRDLTECLKLVRMRFFFSNSLMVSSAENLSVDSIRR